jgi:hypothetical protein
MIVVWYPVSKIGDRIATRSRSADRHKQQIPPLRCAPVGMTNDVNHFRDRALGEEARGDPSAKALGYKPLVFAGFFAGRPKAKALGYQLCASSQKSKILTFLRPVDVWRA